MWGTTFQEFVNLPMQTIINDCKETSSNNLMWTKYQYDLIIINTNLRALEFKQLAKYKHY